MSDEEDFGRPAKRVRWSDYSLALGFDENSDDSDSSDYTLSTYNINEY